MDLTESWAIKIAAEIAPNEVDLAPDMTAAYLAGGEAREQLYMQAKGGGLGGFGSSGAQVTFPIILNCIAVAGNAILTILCSPQVGTILTLIKTALEIKNLAKREEKVKELPEQSYRSLKQTSDAFSTGLKSAGYSQDQCDILTYRFMISLLEDPASAQEFIKSFSVQPNQTNHPKQKRK